MRIACFFLPLLVHALPVDVDGDGWPDAEERAKGFDARSATSRPPAPRFAPVDLGSVEEHGLPVAISAERHRVVTASGHRWSWRDGWEKLSTPAEGLAQFDGIRADGAVIGRIERAEGCDFGCEIWWWDESGLARSIDGTFRSYVAIDDTAPFAWQLQPLAWLRGDDFLVAAKPSPDQIMPTAADMLVASLAGVPKPVWRLVDEAVVADRSGGRWVRPLAGPGEPLRWQLEGAGPSAALGPDAEPVAFSDDGALVSRFRGRLYWHETLGAEPLPITGSAEAAVLTSDDAGEPVAVGLRGSGRAWSLAAPGPSDRLADLVDNEEPWLGFDAVAADSHGTVLAVGSRIRPDRLRRDVDGTLLKSGLAASDCEARIVLLVPLRVRCDHDRAVDVDGLRSRFPMGETGCTPAARPLRLWLNDDHDAGDISEDPQADLPGAQLNTLPNCQRPLVGGNADLVDWFPVCLRLGAAAEDLPPFRVRLLGGELPVAAVETGLPIARAAQYLQRDFGRTHGPGLNQMLGDATKSVPGPSGIVLSDAFSRSLVGGRIFGLGEGTFLLEGRSSGATLIWVCLLRATAPVDRAPTADEILLRAPLRVQVAPVESFYRQWDARSASLSPSAEPTGLPDRLCPGPWLVFTHGFNVDITSGRAWGAEIFKRFHQSGSRARFIAHRWFGDQGAANYAMAVECAPAAADRLAEQARQLDATAPGRPWVLLGHSLGGYVTALAGRERLATPPQVRQLVLVDAALPAEALDPMASDRTADYTAGAGLPAGDLMVPSSGPWRLAPPWTWPEARASRWASLFPSSDLRSTCAWKGRISLGPPVLNVYSRTEDVLMPAPADPSRQPGLLDVADHGAWLYQETHKGRWPVSMLNTRRAQGGWALSLRSTRDARLLLAASPVRRQQLLRVSPLFSAFRLDAALTSPATGPSSQGSRTVARRLRETTGLGSSSVPVGLSWTVRDELLAHAIPALSPPAGSVPVVGVENYRMDGAGASDPPCGELRPFPLGWPRGVESPEHVDGVAFVWRHSDWKNVAYPYVHPTFARIGKSAGLTFSETTP